MRRIVGWWKNTPIARKLYLVVGIMAVLIAGELATLRFSMHTLSAVRAFVGGEGIWSKAQKDAVFDLQRYVGSHDERDYDDFLGDLRVPAGDHQARVELLKQKPDPDVVRRGFLAGRIHPDDIPGIVHLLRHFSQVSYLHAAIGSWTEGDRLLTELADVGAEYHGAVTSPHPDPAQVTALITRLHSLNRELSVLEESFSNELGEGSRWLERIVLTLLLGAVLMVESVGLTLTFLTSRTISRGLGELNTAAKRIGGGDLKGRVPVRSRDEIGQVSQSVNEMADLLQSSYGELEQRVEARTAELALMASRNARLYEEASAALHTRDEFLSVASHELKTPLTGLSLTLQSLVRLARRADGRELVGKIQETAGRASRQVDRLSQLIEELLDLTRIQQGRFELDRETCDLAAITKEAVTQLLPEARTTTSAVSVQASEPVPGLFDPNRMFQVVTNLLTNALKYGGGQPIEVEVSARGDEAQLRVRDHGRGIEPGDQERVFERFERATSDHAIKGLGLGLYITRQIVQAHGGTVTLDSAVGVGSTFTVTLQTGLA